MMKDKMEIIYKKNRKLNIASANEINENIIEDHNRKYVVMINVANNYEINIIEKYIQAFLNKNCVQIYCTNILSEKMHDIFDDYIAEYNSLNHDSLNITTTWDKKCSLKEMLLYFFDTVGKYNDVDFYVIIENKNIEKNIIKYFNKCFIN